MLSGVSVSGFGDALRCHLLGNEFDHVFDDWAFTGGVGPGGFEHLHAEGTANRDYLSARLSCFGVALQVDGCMSVFFFFPELRATRPTAE